jgi:hypothetical protein
MMVTSRRSRPLRKAWLFEIRFRKSPTFDKHFVGRVARETYFDELTANYLRTNPKQKDAEYLYLGWQYR